MRRPALLLSNIIRVDDLGADRRNPDGGFLKIMAKIPICGISLKRVGEIKHQLVQIRGRETVPLLGDLIDIPLGNEPVRGRVVQVVAPPLSNGGVFYVDLDEVVGE
jgi:hypothetical protein